MTILGGLALVIAVVVHAPGLNGPRYWQWTWQGLDGRVMFPAILSSSLPFFWARALRREGRARTPFVLALIAAGVMATATIALTRQPHGLARLHAAIESSGVTAYYTDAEALAREPGWLATHAERLWGLHVHSRTKPAGPIVLYVALIRLFGPGSVSAALGGLLLCAAAAAAVPAVYVLARQLDQSEEGAFEAACLMAWSPGLLLFFPENDQAFPFVTCLALVAWSRAVAGRLRWTIVFGLVAAGAAFFSYSFFVLGVAGLVLAARRPRGAAKAAVFAAAVVVGVYVALHIATGFDPIATFRAAIDNQARLSITWGRRYAPAVLHDPLDFALGVGWIASFLAVVALVRALRRREGRLVPGMAALQIGVVDLTGLLRVEAARVWLLLAPFVVIPAGSVLAGWTERERTAVYVVAVLLLAAVAQNMTFIDLGPVP